MALVGSTKDNYMFQTRGLKGVGKKTISLLVTSGAQVQV